MKTIIFDLKNTLVNDGGQWLSGMQDIFAEAIQSDTRVIVYTMNESWTYDILNNYREDFRRADLLLIVARKVSDDISQLGDGPVLVVGDSITEELAFARALDYDSVDVSNKMQFNKMRDFLEARL